MEEDSLDVYEAICKVKELKYKARNEKEHLVLLCTELAIMKKEKRDLRQRNEELQQMIIRLQQENSQLATKNSKYKEEQRQHQEQKQKHQNLPSIKEVLISSNVSKGIQTEEKLLQNTQTQTNIIERCSVFTSTEKVTTSSVHCDTSDIPRYKSFKEKLDRRKSCPNNSTTQPEIQNTFSILQEHLQKPSKLKFSRQKAWVRKAPVPVPISNTNIS